MISAMVRGIVGSFSGLPKGAQIPAMVLVGSIGSTIIYEAFVIPGKKPKSLNAAWQSKTDEMREFQKMDPINK
eukprot:CAMPEP_0114497020 /NCGR_PEP_ID=MMETSP0109-20121206/6087_1 /TAXON_ID=29199 /ORGANISM="Chlorarachnion reptans, Strain CCCM449" /LENGTH=72 /DNA_ID=CAMNT_0001674345 /DNA_START=166 /DNA_END=384 /DNA_ORIENTATION=+